MNDPDPLVNFNPGALAAHYREFAVASRVLLTGHSHQAWPDCARDGVLQAWQDAARYMDHKWARAMEKAERVKQGFFSLLGEPAPGVSASMSLAASTHDLLVRFLSALPIRQRPRLVTTDGEFHSMRRQLVRLAEEGVKVVVVPSRPAGGVAEKVIDAVNHQTAAVLVSSVFYDSGLRFAHLNHVMEACDRHGVRLLVDAYHHLNVLPFDVSADGLAGAYILGGGYKYCQLGEGNCFMRVPEPCDLRPVVTGWFSEYAQLAGEAGLGRVAYGEGGARFAGATYDPVSHYRAAAVFDFFDDNNLNAAVLHRINRRQLMGLQQSFLGLDADPAIIDLADHVGMDARGGFLCFRSPHAASMVEGLLKRGVYADSRGDVLRLGPAPYVADTQLQIAMEGLAEVVRETGPAG